MDQEEEDVDGIMDEFVVNRVVHKLWFSFGQGASMGDK